jgi:hypothetical protein
LLLYFKVKLNFKNIAIVAKGNKGKDISGLQEEVYILKKTKLKE